jgi:hypothetical protein
MTIQMALRRAPSDVHHRHRGTSTTTIAHLLAVRQDKVMPTTAVLSINCQSVVHLSRASSPVTLHYLQLLHTNHVMVPSALPSACQVYRAVRLAIHPAESHLTHSHLQSTPSWQGPGRLQAVVNRSSQVPYSLIHSTDGLSRAALKVGHKALELIAHPTPARAACPSSRACTFVNVAPKSPKSSTPRMTSGKLKAPCRLHIQKHVS